VGALGMARRSRERLETDWNKAGRAGLVVLVCDDEQFLLRFARLRFSSYPWAFLDSRVMLWCCWSTLMLVMAEMLGS